MSKPQKYSYCLTLRLEPRMETELENMAYQFRTSRAQFIRRAIHRAIADTYRQDHQLKTFECQGGAR